MAIALLPYEVVALAGICKALRGSNLQVRQPTYIEPSFWSRPIYKTAYMPITPYTDWADLLVLQGTKQYVALIKQYAATSLGDLAVSGLMFRMTLNGSPLNVSLTAGIDVNKDGPNIYPIIPRTIFVPVNETQRFALQVKNPTANQQIAIGMLGGWFMEAMDSAVTLDSNAMVDGVSHAMIGPAYGS